MFFSKSVHRQGRSQEIIARMDMDGSNSIDFHDTNGTSELIALVVLPKRSELCWVDKTIVQRHFVYKLWCIGLDQRDQRLVYEHNDLSKLKILTVLNEERFYWTSDER